MAIIFGTNGSDFRRGTAAGDVIFGLAGDDSLFGEGGNDVILAGIGSDLVFGDAGNDILFGQDGHDRLSGGAGNDLLFGGADHDVLRGSDGADRLDGGEGEDTATYSTDPAGAGVVVNLELGQATDGFGAMDTLVSIEHAVGSDGNDTFTGDALDNMFSGIGGNDAFLASGGNDQFDGGEGTDTVIYLSHDAPIRVDLSKEQATDGSGKKDTLKDIENIIGSAFNDRLVGNDRDNDIRGHDGQDTLDGQGGAQDLLFGNDGEDTVSYANDPAGVTADLGAGGGLDGFGGRDFYGSIENATGSAHADTLIGGSDSNLLDGGPGDDTLIGHAGGSFTGGPNPMPMNADVLRGGDGTDTVSYKDDPSSDGAQDGIRLFLEDGTTSRDGHGDPDLVLKVENAIGSQFNDGIVGNSGRNALQGEGGNDTISGMEDDDFLIGGSGDDFLNGGPGNDILWGGEGDDTAVYRNDPTAVFVRLHQGQATDGFELAPGQFGDDSLSSIENVIGSGKSDFIQGNDGDNALLGLVGDDILQGLGGNDTLRGAEGADEAIFVGDLCDYIIRRIDASQIRVTDKVAGRDGTDFLFDIEFITFDDTERFDTSKIALGNSAPVPHGDAFVFVGDEPFTLTGADLLANDCDFDGDVLTVIGIDNVTVVGGAAEIRFIDGELVATFTPAGGGDGGGDVVVLDAEPLPGESLQASFDYVVSDGQGGTAIVGVTVAQMFDVLL